jgi:two-component system, OmpR family, sensor histidine kinase QseC
MRSIRKFLLLNLLISITVILVLTAIGNFLLSNYDIDYHLDNQLMQTTQIIDLLFVKQASNNDLASYSDDLNKSPHDFSGYEYRIWDKRGNLLLSSPSSPQLTPVEQAGFDTHLLRGENWRTYTIVDSKHSIVTTVAESLDRRNELDRRIAWDNIIILICSYPILGIIIWLIVGYALNGLRNLTEHLAQRSATEFSPIDIQDVPDEIKPLTDSLNQLFKRLNEAFERNKRFPGDAAHELRTPLAALKTQAQVALRASDEKERQHGIEKVIMGADRCTHIVQQLLALSRFGAETILNDMHYTDLGKVVMEVTAQLVPLALEKNIEIEFHEPKNIVEIYGNDTALSILIRNLIDNAIRYTPENGEINVYVYREKNHIILKVVDNGPGIPKELRSRVFERFYRLLGTKTAGSGLGLAIVQQIAELHHAKVKLSTPESGKGLAAAVSFSSK